MEQGQWQDKFIERKHSIQVQQHQDVIGGSKVEAGGWTGPGEKEMFFCCFFYLVRVGRVVELLDVERLAGWLRTGSRRWEGRRQDPGEHHQGYLTYLEPLLVLAAECYLLYYIIARFTHNQVMILRICVMGV